MINQTTDYKGYISIHRKIEDSWLWLSEPFSKAQAWIDLLIIANHKPSSFFLRGIKIEVKRGQIAWSEQKLSSRWKWSRGKVRTFLKLLETEQQIKQHKSNKINIVEIINYNLYQKQDNRLNNRKTTERQQIEQQKDIYNNVNNDNNVNKLKEQFEEIYRLYNKEKRLKVIPFDKLKNKFQSCLKEITFDELRQSIIDYLEYLSTEGWRKKKAFESWINSPEFYANDWKNESREDKNTSQSNGNDYTVDFINNIANRTLLTKIVVSASNKAQIWFKDKNSYDEYQNLPDKVKIEIKDKIASDLSVNEFEPKF